MLFGIGHLPATVQVGYPTPLLNGLLGVVFGWLFARRGLESVYLAQ